MRTKILLIILVFCLTLVPAPRAQDSTPTPTSPAPGPVVALSLIVTDKDDKGVSTIRKAQIRLFEDKVEQSISLETDERPIDYGIVIDASGSFRMLIASALEAVTLIIRNQRPTDEIFIERFISSDKVEKYRDFTTDGNALIESLKTFKIEAGQSAVVDALHTAVEYVADHNRAKEGRRKAVIIITDGEDRNSAHSPEGLIKLLRERGVQVFAIGLVLDLDRDAGLIRMSPREKAEKLLQAVASESGGRVFFPKNKDELINAAKEISLDLRAQYRVKYQSTNDASKTGFRKVEAKFVSTDGQKRKLIVPPGYYAGTTSDPPKSEKKP
jgi:Ca-activated chloride channel homolog